MDQDTAQVLFREGATFVLIGMPEGSEFGIDYNSWTVGPKFRGVKMIPPGVHFIYYSSNSSSEGKVSGLRTGFFYNFKQKEMLVKKWDKFNEALVQAEIFMEAILAWVFVHFTIYIQSDDISREEEERFTSNKEELDQYLGSYPYENYKKWVSMTSHLTDDLLSRLQPDCGTIYSVSQFKSVASNSQMRKEAESSSSSEESSSPVKSPERSLPELETIAGTEIKFTNIPKQRYPDGATPQEITKHSMDSTYLLTTLLNTHYSDDNSGILGEIQFAFICFLIGQVYDAFDQWKKVVHLMCSCEEALNLHSDLYMKFISVLHFQVHEIPEDFFVDIVSSNNFLTTTLQEFFSNLQCGNGSRALQQRGKKFQEHLTKKFRWDFTTEPDDYAPVIVDT